MRLRWCEHADASPQHSLRVTEIAHRPYDRGTAPERSNWGALVRLPVFRIVVLTELPNWLVASAFGCILTFTLFETGIASSLTVNLLDALLLQFIVFVGLAAGVSVLSISY